MKLIELYKSILDAIGLTADDKGLVSFNAIKLVNKKENTPIIIDGKRLVLPLHEHTSDPDKTTKIVFHPLSENILRGESLVISSMRSYITTRLDFTIGPIMIQLLDICADVTKHKHLDPDQSSVLTVAPMCDETTVSNFSTMMLRAIKENKSCFIKFYLKRSGVVKGQKFARAGIVSFPFFEEICKEQDTYYGVKLRKKDRQAIIGMFNYILPNIDKEETYNRGSNSDIAPFLDSLMKTFMGIGSKLNDVIEQFSSVAEDLRGLVINGDWVEDFQDLTALKSQILLIPAQPGNEGESKKNENQTGALSSSNNLQYTPPPVSGVINTTQPQTPVQQHTTGFVQTAPVQTNAQQNQNSEGKVSFSDLLKPTQQPVVPAVVWQQPMVPPAALPPSLLATMTPEQLVAAGYQVPGVNVPMNQMPQVYNNGMVMGSMPMVGQYNQMMQQQFMPGYSPMGGPGMARSVSTLAGNPMMNNGFSSQGYNGRF
jgi:hypothetical protein